MKNEVMIRLRCFRAFLQKPFFSDGRTLFGLWLLLPVIASLLKISKHNNYLIFRYVFWHTIEQKPLYAAYDEYWDTNHYGPFFSLVIAPFALLPGWVGMLFGTLPCRSASIMPYGGCLFPTASASSSTGFAPTSC